MYKKAQSMIEIAMLAALIAVVAISLMTIFNNQKNTLAGKSEVKLVETGGKSAIRSYRGNVQVALDNLTYEDFNDTVEASPKGQDIITLASELGIKVDSKSTDAATLIALKNKAVELSNKDGALSDNEDAYLNSFVDLLNNSGKSSGINHPTTTNTSTTYSNTSNSNTYNSNNNNVADYQTKILHGGNSYGNLLPALE